MRDTNFGEPAEILQTSELDTDSFQRVTRMRQVALESWWAPRHPGWGIIDEAPPDGRHWLTNTDEAPGSESKVKGLLSDFQAGERTYL